LAVADVNALVPKEAKRTSNPNEDDMPSGKITWDTICTVSPTDKLLVVSGIDVLDMYMLRLNFGGQVFKPVTLVREIERPAAGRLLQETLQVVVTEFEVISLPSSRTKVSLKVSPGLSTEITALKVESVEEYPVRVNDSFGLEWVADKREATLNILGGSGIDMTTS